MYKRILLTAAVAAVGTLVGATEATFINASGAPWHLERCGLLADGELGEPDGTVIHLRALSLTRLDLWDSGAHGYRLRDSSGWNLCSVVGGRAGTSGAPGLVLASPLAGEELGRLLRQESPLVLKILANGPRGLPPGAATGPVEAKAPEPEAPDPGGEGTLPPAPVPRGMAGSPFKPVRIGVTAGGTPSPLPGEIRMLESYERETRGKLEAARVASDAVEAGAPLAGAAPCGPWIPGVLRWQTLAERKEKEGSCLSALQHVQNQKIRYFLNGPVSIRKFASPWGNAILRDCHARGKRAGEESRLRKAEAVVLREIAVVEFMLDLGWRWVAGLRAELDDFEARRGRSVPEFQADSFPAADTLLQNLTHLPPSLEPAVASMWMNHMALDHELEIQLARARALAGDAPARGVDSSGDAPD